MRIIEFHAQNFCRIKAIEIIPNPNENCVYISGDNGQGKSSVLNAIWSVLEYTASKKNVYQPIRDGADKATVQLNLGDYIVTRIFKPDKTELKVETKNGDMVRSPHRLISGWLGSLGFDPYEFANADDKKQREMLLEYINVDIDVLEAQKRDLTEERKLLKRDKKKIETEMGSIAPPTQDDPSQEVSAKDLIEKISHASQLVVLQNELKQLRTTQAEIEAKILSTIEKISRISDDNNDSLEILEQKLQVLEAFNKRAIEVQKYNSLHAELQKLTSQIDLANNKIELLDIQKAEAIEAAQIPVRGLTVEPEGVLLDGVPFKQASKAQKIRVSMALAMASNPQLRVIRIEDGSLVGEQEMKIIQEMAEKNDFQIWIEKVDTSGDVGVYIVDGEVAKDNT